VELKLAPFPPDLNTGQESRWSTLLAWCVVSLLPWTWLSGVWGLLALSSFLGMVALNISFYRFLARQRNVGFALTSIPCHLLFYLECGLAGLLGLLLHGRDRWHYRFARVL
jgi:hypothetical protein